MNRGFRCRLMVCLLIATAGLAAAQKADKKPPIAIVDVDGVSRKPLENLGQRAVVLFFVTNDCPITNAYAPEMERICNAYKSRGVRFYAIYTDPTVSAAEAKKHSKDFGLTCTAICDMHHVLVKNIGATITPETAVVLPNGTIAYRGRIDNLYIDFGKARSRASSHELKDALDEVLSGKPVKVSRTKAIGCYISL